MGEWMYKPTFLDLGTSWRRVVSFILRPLYHMWKSPRHPLDKRLGWPQTTWKRENTLPSQESNSNAIPTELSRLLNNERLWRIRCSGMLRRVIRNIFTDVSEEFGASIWKVLWRWIQYVPPKRCSISSWLQSVTCQKSLALECKSLILINCFFWNLGTFWGNGCFQLTRNIAERIVDDSLSASFLYFLKPRTQTYNLFCSKFPNCQSVQDNYFLLQYFSLWWSPPP
jgi:hypothetical protein